MTDSYPTGPITLLFADVESSSDGWQQYGDTYGGALARLHALARTEATHHRGDYVKHTGDGFLLAFSKPVDALLCACRIQCALASVPEDQPQLRLRIGVHTDTPRLVDGEYTGFAVWRAQRIMDAATGGQVLLSEGTYALARGDLAGYEGCACEPLGDFRLRGVEGVTALYRLAAPGLTPSANPVRARPHRNLNLPDEERPFIGREREVADLTHLLQGGPARLVVVTGIGGVGKSRLAREVARRVEPAFPGGVWLVELEALEAEEEVAAAVRAALPVDIEPAALSIPNAPPVQTDEMLVLLDCFERLASHAPLVERLLRLLPNARCLVTSRVVLGLDREFEYPLDPMPTAAGSHEGAPLADSERLFEEAATHVAPGFKITPGNRPVVAELCRALEGIPLSVLLAAARLRHLSPADLLAQVRARRFGVLRRTAGAAPRHAALQMVVADSIALLPQSLSRLLLRLSVFTGGFFLADVQHVCVLDDNTDIIEGIALLREHSLLSAETVGEHTRFRLLDTIREYLASLPRDDQSAADLALCRSRHAHHFAGVARRVDELMRKGLWSEGTSDLSSEYGNLRAAVSHAIEEGDDALVVSFAASLGRIYAEAALWDDFQRLADAADQAAERLQRADVQASTLGLRGAVAARKGHREQARQLWERRVALSVSIGDNQAAADTLLDLADQAREAGKPHSARQLLGRALRVCGRQGDPGIRASARAIHADILLGEGRRQEAMRSAGKAAATARFTQDPGAALYCHARLGRIYCDLGALDASEAELVAAVRLAAEGNRDMSLIGALLDLSALHVRRGSRLQAARAAAIAAAIHPELVSKRTRAAAQAVADLAATEDQDTEAVRAYLQAASTRSWKDLLPEFVGDPPAGPPGAAGWTDAGTLTEGSSGWPRSS